MKQEIKIGFEHIKENCKTIREVKQLSEKLEKEAQNALKCEFKGNSNNITFN